MSLKTKRIKGSERIKIVKTTSREDIKNLKRRQSERLLRLPSKLYSAALRASQTLTNARCSMAKQIIQLLWPYERWNILASNILRVF